jgi:hypothetical protein
VRGAAGRHRPAVRLTRPRPGERSAAAALAALALVAAAAACSSDAHVPVAASEQDVQACAEYTAAVTRCLAMAAGADLARTTAPTFAAKAETPQNGQQCRQALQALAGVCR